MLKQFKLLIGCFYFFLFFTDKQLHIPKLLIGNTKNTDLAGWWEKTFYSFHVYFSVFSAGAMSQINRKLEHRETILD